MQEEVPEVIVEDLVLTNDPTVVYDVDFLQNEFCTSFETMSITDFGACASYVNLELFIAYASLLAGLLIGFIISKAVADSWS